MYTSTSGSNNNLEPVAVGKTRMFCLTSQQQQAALRKPPAPADLSPGYFSPCTCLGHNVQLLLSLKFQLGLLLGTEAPVMTPNDIDFSLFFLSCTK